jgi:hypothetical protein
MNIKMIVSIVMIALVASMGVVSAYNAGDSGVAYPGVPCVTPISGGDCVNVYASINTFEAATLGWTGYEEGVAYAGRPFIGAYLY